MNILKELIHWKSFVIGTRGSGMVSKLINKRSAIEMKLEITLTLNCELKDYGDKKAKAELVKDFLESYKYKNEKGESLKNSILESKYRPNGDHWTLTAIQVEDLGELI